MKKILFAALFASLSACSGLPSIPKFGECVIEYPYADVEIDHVRPPASLSLDNISDITARDGRITMSPDGFSSAIQWQHEMDRIMKDLREWYRAILGSIRDQNAANRAELTEGEPEEAGE